MEYFYVALDSESFDLSAKLDASVPMWGYSLAFRNTHGELRTESHKWSDLDPLLALTADDSVKFVIHNASFDVPAFRLHGVNIKEGKYVDTMLLAYLMQPDAKQFHSLSSWGEFLGEPKSDFHKASLDAGLIPPGSKKGEEFKVGWTATMAAYAEQDAKVTYLLWEYLNKPEFHDADLFEAYYSIELPYLEVIMEMEQQGSYMDREYLRKLGEETDVQIARTQEAIRAFMPMAPELKWDADSKTYVPVVKEYANELYLDEENPQWGRTSYVRHLTPVGQIRKARPKTPPKRAKPDHYYRQDNPYLHSVDFVYTWEHCPLVEFNSKSDHLPWYLMTFGKWKPKKKTKSGKWQLDGKVLGTIKHPLAQLAKQYEDLTKLRSTYVDALLAASEKDGFVHGSFNAATTRTTRLSSEKPNLQNIPSVIRPAFVPPPGKVLLMADLDAIEVAIQAFFLEVLFGDEGMSNEIRAGRSPHTYNAKMWDVPRKLAKTILFGIVYGQTEVGLAEKNDQTVRWAENIMEKVYDAMPSLLDFKEYVLDEAHAVREFEWVDLHTAEVVKDGFLRLLTGQRVYVPDIFSSQKWQVQRAERQLGNYIIQGSASGINKWLHLRVWREAKKRKQGDSFIVVHDENGLYVSEEYLAQHPEYIDLLTQLNSSDIILKDVESGVMVPVTSKYQLGYDWEEAKAEFPFCNIKNKERWTCLQKLTDEAETTESFWG